MYGIDNATAAAAAPTYPAAGVAGHFSKGNPSTSTAATVVDDWWLDQVNQELLNVLSAGGVTPSKGANNQVATAIANLISGATTPPSVVAWFARNTAPAGWLVANGAAVSRATYANLFAAIGITFGAGDGSTTFNLPDLRGEFVRAWDNGRGLDPSRSFGSSQQDAMQGHIHGPPAAGTTYRTGGGGSQDSNGGGSNSNYANTGDPVADSHGNGTPRTAAETRPVNVALLACIKY
jgi:phage-related tail fiber protein